MLKARFPIHLGVLALALLAALAGCGGSGSQSMLAAPSPAGRATRLGQSADGLAGRLSISPAAAADLMYVVDNGSETVYQYSYPAPKRLGKIEVPFYDVLTICLNTSQDIFVVDNAAQSIREYSRDGQKVLKTMIDFSGFPLGCSVDPTTGNVAVTNNQAGTYGQPGNVVIYPHGNANGKTYSIPNTFFYHFPAYDDKGNLFVNGHGLRPGPPVLGELAKGAGSFKDLKINVKTASFLGMQWDGKYLAVCDIGARPNEIDRFSISRSGATKVSSTTLKGDDDVYQFSIAAIGGKTMLIATDPRNRRVFAWRYPVGGSPALSIGGFADPLDAVVSLGSK